MKPYVLVVLVMMTHLVMTFKKQTHTLSTDYEKEIISQQNAQQLSSHPRLLLSITRQPMRISINTDDLDATNTPADSTPSTTIQNLNVLKKAAQVAQSFFQARLSLIPESKVDIPQFCTADYKTPTTDFQNDINTDLHIYIIHLTDSGKSYNAEGIYCQKIAENSYPDTTLKSHRPTVGLLKYNTYQIIDQKNSMTNRLFSSITATTIHEFIHILGFNSELYQYYMDLNTGSKHEINNVVSSTAQTLHSRRSGGKNLIFKSPHVKAWAKDHFQCTTLDGIPLENQDSSDKNTGAHWERLTVYDQIMTGSQLGSQKAFSGLTFSLLKDMGWYGVDSSFNDSLNYGKSLGCSFYSDACYGTTTYDKYFCDVIAYDQVTSCSTNYLGKGDCSNDISLMADGCGIFIDHDHCADPDTGNIGYEKWTFEKYQTDSFCVKGSFATVAVSPNYAARCYPFQCDLTNKKIIFTIEQSTVTCAESEKGFEKTLNSFQGKLQCPDYTSFCLDSRKICPNWCSQKGFCTNGICNCAIVDGVVYSGEDCSKNACSVDQFYQASSDSCVTDCQDGFYPNKFSRTCMPCNSECSKCRDQPHICTGCTAKVGQTLFFVKSTSKCVSQCPDGTYRDGQFCEDCSSAVKCKTCKSAATICTSCINIDPDNNPYFLSQPTQGSCNLNCPTGGYDKKDVINFICQSTCPPQLVQTSELGQKYCKTCEPQYKEIDKTDNTCVSSCGSGYYTDQVNYLCGLCDQTCKECKGSYPENCTACHPIGSKPQNYLYLSMCLSSCPDGFYKDDDSLECKICDKEFNCYRCQKTADGLKCLSCLYGYYYQQDQTCTEGCETHKFKNTWNQSCDDCHENCKDCISPYESSCLNCYSPKYLIKRQKGIYCVDACPTQGYVTFAATTCQPCHQTCKKCTGLTSSDCTQCIGTQLYLEDGSCRYVCSPGKYPETTTKTCEQCDENCEFCFGNTVNNCTKCKLDLVLDNTTCTSSCPDGQLPNNFSICEMKFLNVTSHAEIYKHIFGLMIALLAIIV